jgi:hypothetical protein
MNEPGQQASATAACRRWPDGLAAATPRKASPLAAITTPSAAAQSGIDPDALRISGQSGKKA